MGIVPKVPKGREGRTFGIWAWSQRSQGKGDLWAWSQRSKVRGEVVIFQNKVKMGGALLGMEKGGCQGPFFFTVPQAALYPCTALESLLALKDLSRLSMALL